MIAGIMVYFPSLMFTGFTQGAAFTATAATSALTANVVRDFFMNIFLHPGENYIAVMVLGGAAIGACIGLAFLVKLVYEKYCPEQI